MSCDHCKVAVEADLNRISDVEISNADFEWGTVEVRYDERRVTTDDIENAVEMAGCTLTA